MADDLLEYYRHLLDKHWILRENACVCWIENATRPEAARHFGIDLVGPSPQTLLEAAEEADGAGEHAPGIIVLDDLPDGWALGVEPRGAQGFRPEVMRGLSARGTAFAVRFGGRPEFALYRRGARIAQVQHLTGRWGAAPHELDELMKGLPCAEGSPEDSWQEAALALGERVTGVRLDVDRLGGALDRYTILRRKPVDPVPLALREHPVAREPEFAAILADPAGRRRAIAVLAARQAVTDTGLSGPEVTAALRSLGSMGVARPRTVNGAGRLDAAALRAGLRTLTPGLDGDRALAVKVLIAALDPDDGVAAGEATRLGWRIHSGGHDAEVRWTILRTCARTP
ncbi:hypothetical protein Acor_22050 [Acrocarpospora corrugata]|uniref:Uncharacterized protein n=1 Tax=Acrocarpospora corrugata TaxID=35763 RepID=A0A5M3VWS2_9ACTN|nr:DUF6461 domain-containing protein [Acrocarpospora corrugata]GES00142.1 hypothetical protein Acor_22050 [Acrocarpospora corrugata]